MTGCERAWKTQSGVIAHGFRPNACLISDKRFFNGLALIFTEN